MALVAATSYLVMAVLELKMLRSPVLEPFLLKDVKRTGKQLGVGSYGAVEELLVGGAVCAGKKLHETLMNPGEEGVKCMLERFASECQLMASLRHPHVVQFLGLCFFPGATVPFLVMERMHTSLDKVCDGLTLGSLPYLPLLRHWTERKVFHSLYWCMINTTDLTMETDGIHQWRSQKQWCLSKFPN